MITSGPPWPRVGDPRPQTAAPNPVERQALEASPLLRPPFKMPIIGMITLKYRRVDLVRPRHPVDLVRPRHRPILFYSALSGGLAALGLQWAGRSARLPFAPLLTLGTLLAVFAPDLIPFLKVRL